MIYFSYIHLQSGKDEEKTFFLILDGNSENPTLTKEYLIASKQYADFKQTYKPKITYVDYTVYKTDCEIFASTPDDEIQVLINNGKCEKISSSELQIGSSQEKAIKKKSPKRKKKSPVKTVAIIGVVSVIVLCAFGAGNKLGKRSQNNIVETPQPEQIVNQDGMIIPEQQEIPENAEQITVAIDRSYSSTPQEDIQLKGEVIDGVAQITLPEFDKTDFFTHVQGYTWGFNTDPDATKIEYYGGITYKFNADTKLYRVLVKYGGGSGTKDDPYIIDYYDQLELIGKEKARGYFKQVADLKFPDYALHNPIDTLNELKTDPTYEIFEYDGGGYCIENLKNPLFGTVSGAVIKNVNIKSSTIETQEYRDLAFIVCNAINYHYVTENGTAYETGETLIKHCTVSHSSIFAQYPEAFTQETTETITAPVVVPPDLIEYDENGNVIEHKEVVIEPVRKAEYAIGAISGIGGQIEDCYVTDFGVISDLDDYYLYVGGISGKPANVINSGVYYSALKGKIFYAGGIAGSCGGAKMYDVKGNEYPEYYGGNFQGCVARNIILNAEYSGGGIGGEGTSNAENPIISNCYANELDLYIGIYDDDFKQIKSGSSGGILGSDGSEKYGHTIQNTVSLANYNAIGSSSKSQYDESIRLAPEYAFYQPNILSILNMNTVENTDSDSSDSKEIFTGDFKFSDNTVFGDDTGALPYPSAIEDLFEKTIIVEENIDEQ